MTTASHALDAIAAELFEQSPQEHAFNPYADRNPDVDREDAVAIRRANLANYLEACDPRPRLFLLAEAPGPWGCRFSGVPITSEAQLLDPGFPIRGRQSSLKETPHGEYSATIFWKLMADVFPGCVIWNACPLHPYKPGLPFTIRAPRVSELRRYAPLAAKLIDIYKPERVLAVGRKAERTLTDVGIPATYVRHPSQGGANLFRDGVQKALREVAHG